jgi:anti-anti-sigma factor
MDITETKQNSTLVLSLSGRLDGLTSSTLERKVTDCAAAGAKKIVFDCAKLVYVSSAGLRVFLSSAKKLKAAGGGAAFAALSPAVNEVFELSGFTGVLTVCATDAEAVAALG